MSKVQLFKVMVFWIVMPCSFAISQPFNAAYQNILTESNHIFGDGQEAPHVMNETQVHANSYSIKGEKVR
jgi:hypothetical protein